MSQINHQSLKHCAYALCIGTTLLISACGSSPTPNYYTLATPVTSTPSGTVRIIEVMPIGLPDRLDRVQIVVQDTNGQSQLLDNQRWTSTFSAELRDGLSARLQQRLGAVDRYHGGVSDQLPTYRIMADFTHFDALGLNNQHEAASNINVAVAWTISRLDDTPLGSLNTTPSPKPQIACRMTFTTPVNTTVLSGINGIVTTSRESLDRVATAIAASVQTMEGGAAPADAVCH